MKIATFNIDWVKKGKTKIETFLNQIDADILVLTESIREINLTDYDYIYTTKIIPKNGIFEGLDYSKILNKNTGLRVSVYSKYKSVETHRVLDNHTSVCETFETEIGHLTIYATIIGTWFQKMPYAENEMKNCEDDILALSKKNKNIVLIGDLNTSFDSKEIYHEIRNIKSRKRLVDLCGKSNLDFSHTFFSENIDHILISQNISDVCQVSKQIFIEKNRLSDHLGVLLDIKKQPLKANGC
jgi:exonuclease III